MTRANAGPPRAEAADIRSPIKRFSDVSAGKVAEAEAYEARLAGGGR